MVAPRLIATDLDGTLLDPSGQLTPRARRAIMRLAQLQIETVFVTARPPRRLDDLDDVVGGHGLAICANGAFLYDVGRREVVRSHCFQPDQLAELAADLRRALPGIGFAGELATGMHLERSYPEVHPRWRPQQASYGSIEDAPSGVGKLLARIPEVAPDPRRGEGSSLPGGADTHRFLDLVARVIGERAHVSYSGAVGLAEIVPAGVSKASALAAWCTERGIEASQVWAFGDMPNDVPMLSWAGRSFAVAGGHELAHAAATDVCPGNDVDGVAQILETIGSDAAPDGGWVR
ncbi:HAD family hydrolase [Gephyromycinifex aptenodytis]|uniref:HAD family hydrolase n=1 Tax=Gephyromycinifex aptenodytis TaxID=2716227 RepID=UPI001445B1F2|nr:HAD family hydrolase [Gephyromycinifex aptenodytis]